MLPGFSNLPGSASLLLLNLYHSCYPGATVQILLSMVVATCSRLFSDRAANF